MHAAALLWPERGGAPQSTTAVHPSAPAGKARSSSNGGRQGIAAGAGDKEQQGAAGVGGKE